MPVRIPSRRDDVSSNPTARSASPGRERYNHQSPTTASITTPMNANGIKLTVELSLATTSLLIGPSGALRSQSDAPSRMLSVPSVAMIDGSRKKRISVALKTPVATPTPTTASAPNTRATVDASGFIVNDAVTTHIVISAATETSNPRTSSAHVCPIATSASGIVVINRFPRLYFVRNASCRIPA